MNGVFIALKLSDSDQQAITKFCLDFDLEPLPLGDYHLTLHGDKSSSLHCYDGPTELPAPVFLRIDKTNNWGIFNLPHKNIWHSAFIGLLPTDWLVNYRINLIKSLNNQELVHSSGKVREKFLCPGREPWKPHVTISFDNTKRKFLRLGTETMTIRSAMYKFLKFPLDALTFDRLIVERRNADYGSRMTKQSNE